MIGLGSGHAARAFVDSLSEPQRERALFPLESEAWRRWSNIHPFLMRHGVSLDEMSAAQRERALAAYPALMKDTLGGYYTLGRLFVQVIGQPQVMRIATRYGISLGTLAFAWVLRHPSRPHPITGSGRIDGLRDAVAALDVQLDAEDWYAIWTASKGHSVP